MFHDNKGINNLPEIRVLMLNNKQGFALELEIGQDLHDPPGRIFVKLRSRFVQDQDVITRGERRRKSDTLLLATGESMR